MTPQARWSNKVTRVLWSPNPALRPYRYLGDHYETGRSHLECGQRDNPHTLVTGGSGGGKTYLAAAGNLVQRLGQGHSLFVSLFKPDPALFYTLRHEAEGMGVPFRFVDISPGRHSYVLNLFEQRHSAAQSIFERMNTVAQGVGQDPGAANTDQQFFATMGAEMILASLLFLPQARTLRDMVRGYRESKKDKFKELIDDRAWRLTTFIRSLLRYLGSITPFNVRPGSPLATPEVMRWAIELGDLFVRPQVLVLLGDAARNRIASRLAVGLALQQLYTASLYLRDRRDLVPVTAFLDDAGEIVASSTISTMLELARSAGIELWLSHQDYTQLGLRHRALEENTGMQVLFDPTADDTVRSISENGGSGVTHDMKWTQPHDLPLAPRGTVSVGAVPTVKYSPAAVRRISAEPGVAWVRLRKNAEYAPHHGLWHPVRMHFHISRERYEFLQNLPFAGPSPRTVLVRPVMTTDDLFGRGEDEPPPPPLPTPRRPSR